MAPVDLAYNYSPILQIDALSYICICPFDLDIYVINGNVPYVMHGKSRLDVPEKA